MKKKLLIAIVVVIVLAVAYWLISPLWRVIEVSDAMPETKSTPSIAVGEPAPGMPQLKALSGQFVAGAHEVAGSAKVIDTVDGKVLRFEDFETVNGPDLRIYLATDTSADDYVDLGPIRGTKGDINYTLPAGTDLTKYDTVLVWCRAFSKLFSSAELR